MRSVIVLYESLMKMVEYAKMKKIQESFAGKINVTQSAFNYVNGHDMKLYLDNRKRRVCSETQGRACKQLRQDTYLTPRQGFLIEF